jgi:hypothetical protein
LAIRKSPISIAATLAFFFISALPTHAGGLDDLKDFGKNLLKLPSRVSESIEDPLNIEALERVTKLLAKDLDRITEKMGDDAIEVGKLIGQAADRIDPGAIKELVRDNKELSSLVSALKRALKNSRRTKAGSQFSVRYDAWGDPYVNLWVFVDNPPGKNGLPILTAGKNLVAYCHNQCSGTVDISSYFTKVGDHTLDIYVTYPGNNDARVNVDLIPYKKSGKLGNPIFGYHVNNTSHHNFGGGMKHRTSTKFSLRASKP